MYHVSYHVTMQLLAGHSKCLKVQLCSQEAPCSYQVRTDDGGLYRCELSSDARQRHSGIEGQYSNSTTTRKPTDETLQLPL